MKNVSVLVPTESRTDFSNQSTENIGVRSLLHASYFPIIPSIRRGSFVFSMYISTVKAFIQGLVMRT